MNYEMLKLDNQLCFALYACSKEVTKTYKPFLDKLGLTYTQYITLLVLWEQDNLTVKELGKKLHLDSGTLTPLLKKLEGIGLIQRIRDMKDERNVYVKLTEKGSSLKEEALEIPNKVFRATGVSKEDVQYLKTKLKLLLSNLDS